MKTLFLNGMIHTLTDEDAEWVVVDGTEVTHAGTGEAPSAERTIDLQGATLVPAFCDAHVHLSTTGLMEAAIDLTTVTALDEIERLFAERAGDRGAILFGGNYQDPTDARLGRAELDRATGGRPALVARADMHACVASSAVLDHLDLEGLEGVDRDGEGNPTGYLRERAAGEAWRWFDGHLSDRQQADAVRAAARRAYSKGVAHVHEMFVVEWRSWASLDALVHILPEIALEVTPYVATAEVGRVKALGFPRIGGDFFLDGSFGSHTAWMVDPFSSPPPESVPATGISYRSDDELFEFFSEAQAAGLQVGVHAIGDAAIEQAVRTWERVAGRVGVPDVRRLGHRIEHFECGTDDHMRRAAQLSIAASVQPAFDRFWGGEGGLYEKRIGGERARSMNRFNSMVQAGLVVGAGSDSTVTPLDPFLQMVSLRAHNVDGERVDAHTALALHTHGSHALAGAERARVKGRIAPGYHADFALLDRDPLEIDVESLLRTEVLGTWIGGRRVWPPEEAETE